MDIKQIVLDLCALSDEQESAGVNCIRIQSKYGVQYMIKQRWKIREERIAVEKAARVYYTHQGVSQRSEKLQCDTPFLMGKIRE